MGSLFQLRDFWYRSFAEEEFSPSAVAVGDLDNLDTIDKVAIGSFQGYLRILLPGAVRGEMQPEDVLLEQKFDEPILQLACGRFLPVSATESRYLLAVLFPRRLVLLNIERAHDGAGASTDGEQDNAANTGGKRSTGSVNNLGLYYTCTQHYETRFEHTTYNFTLGSFGRCNRDLICVQSMDGQLTIVDHNKVLCQRFFPTNQFLVPGAITYCPQRDAFLTNNSSMFLMCYKFSTITNSVGSERKDRRDEDTGDVAVVSASSGGSGVRIAPAWAYNLGDDAVDIKVCRLTRGMLKHEANIVVLCPYSLYVLSLDGEPLFNKRLDVEMCSLCTYPLPEINAANLLLGGFNGALYVYSDVALEWSALMTSGVPLFLDVATLCGTQGMILSLNSEGTLTANYLGTDPAEKPIQPLESKVASYTDMATELKFVQQTIRQLLDDGEESAIPHAQTLSPQQQLEPAPDRSGSGATGGGGDGGDGGLSPSISSAPTEPFFPVASLTQSAGEDVRVASPNASPRAVKPTLALFLGFGTPEAVNGAGGGFILPLIIRLDKPFQHLSTLQDIVVQLDSVDPVTVEPAHKTLPCISVGETLTVPVRVTAAPDKDHIVPSSLDVTAVVVFTCRRHDTWAARKTTQAPLALVARSVPPVKNTSFTLQLNTNKSPPPSLIDLFSDLATYGNVTPNVLSIHYLNGTDATILVSKNAARFKLQGSTMEGLWLLTNELVRRVKTYYAKKSKGDESDDLVFSIPDDVPLVDFTSVIDTHAAIRKELADAVGVLDRAAQYLRNVEKRLLVRFRDRNPTGSDAMTVLFEESYALLQRATDGVVLAKSRQRQACAMLNCCARLVFFWMRVKYPESLQKTSVAVRTMPVSQQQPGARRRSSVAGTSTEDLLGALFTCDISADDGVGWEEVTEAALVHLLDIKTRKVAANTALEVSLSTANLTKYVAQLVDYIKAGKGF